MAIENILTYANIVLVVINMVFIIFYYLQLRETKKAVIHTKFMNYNKRSNKKQNVAEKDPFYFYVTNESDRLADNFAISAKAVLTNKEKKIIGEKEFKQLKLDYINPHERIQTFLFRLGDFAKYFPELFEEHSVEKGKRFFIAPKEKLVIKLYLTFKWGSGYKYKQKDYYEINWESPNELKTIENHPIVRSINKRNGFLVEKLK